MPKSVNPVRSRSPQGGRSRAFGGAASIGVNPLKAISYKLQAKKVFVTRLIPDQGLKMLQDKGYEVVVRTKDSVITKKELVAELEKGYDALLCLLTDKIDSEIMDAGSDLVPEAPRALRAQSTALRARKAALWARKHFLKIIANYAVGFDNIDLEAAKKRNLQVTNAPCRELTEAVAEHTFALMITLAHRIVEADKFIRTGKYRGWEPRLMLGTDLHDKTLGIVGLGRIGFSVAQRAVKGFRMKVLYNDVKPNPEFEKEFGGRYVALEELLKKSDFVTLHVPLLPSTRYLMNKKTFGFMKKTAYLINTSRGPIVEEKALLEALKTKKIAGAGLDVFECEPSIDCNLRDHLELKKFDNVVLTPHTASATIETRQAMSRVAATNIIEALEGRTPPNIAK